MRRGIALWITAVLGLVACSGGPGAGPAASAPDANEVAAEVGSEKITVGELDTQAKERLYVRETRNGDASAVYELREEAMQAWIEERALASEAKKRGLDVDALVAEEVAKRGPVTDAEVSAFYEANKSRVQGHTLEQLSDDIRRHLESLREREVREALVKQANVAVHLEPPRVQVSSSGPSIGPADAPVVLIEFSDFQCPFCARAHPVIQTLRERYPTQLRVVYKHLPLEAIHPRARAAAEAAVCAEQQGKFWEYHDRLFSTPGALSDDDLKGYASAVGLDMGAFGACLQDPKRSERVEADMAEARAAGVTGTPAFVLNGRLLKGLQPPDAMIARIDKELGPAAPKPGAPAQASP
jgi:protein-disulfide isomerase